MIKQREEIDEEIKAEVEKLRNTYDTLMLVETPEFTKEKLMVPYLNGQAGVCQATLQGNITEAERYNIMKKLIAYQTCMTEYIILEEESETVAPEPPPADLKDAGEPW